MQDLYRVMCVKYQKHFSDLLDIECKILDASEESAPTLLPQEEVTNFCAHCRYEKDDELSTHLYGCHEAHRWNGKYIYYCPLGLTFIAASVQSANGTMIGGLVLGPIVMGDMQDTLYDLAVPEMAWAISKLSVFSTREVRHISEILAAVTENISNTERRSYKNMLYDQNRILSEINLVKDRYAGLDNQSVDMLLQFERNLRLAVINGEKASALVMINDMLAQTYVYSNYDIAAIKARLLELLVILSRATIEAGADPVDTFRLSEDFILQIEQYVDVDQLAFWISDIVRRFIVQAFDLAQAKHSDVVFKVTNYIKKNCAEKLSLDSLAKEVFLSKSYLSNIFKKETSLSLTGYITKVRVERSKKLLLEDNISLAVIASQCGFKDQSYFTKVFKKEVGVSPKKYKDTYFHSATK